MLQTPSNYSEPSTPFLGGNTHKETMLVTANAEDVDVDIHREPLRLMHNMPNPSVIALSLASGEGCTVPMTYQTEDVWVPLQEPARDIAAPILQTSVEDVSIANETPSPKTLVDVYTSKQPDPNASGQSARLFQETLRREGCSEHCNHLFLHFYKCELIHHNF